MMASNKTYIYLLILIAIATHLIWFIPGSVLFHGDWFHWSDTAAGQAWTSLGTWNSFFEFGTPRILIGFTLMQDLWSLIVNMGGSFDTAVRLTLLAPIAILGFVAPYILLRRFVADNFVSFAGAIFYGSTTYFLIRQGSHIPISFIYALSPLIIFFFAKAIETFKTRDWLAFALVYALGLCYEVRIMYILTFVLFLYAILFFPKKRFSQTPKQLLLIASIILGLSSFWLLPTLFGGAQSLIAETANRGLFGSFLFDLPHALTVSVSGWTGGPPNESFIKQPVKAYLWLVPIIMVGALAVRSKMTYQRRKLIIFFTIIALVGIFLTKQELDPLPQAYSWLYSNFPGFSLFREASKFYLLTAIGYMGLLGVGLVGLRRVYPVLFHISTVALITIGFINLLPLITGSMGTLFVSRHIPKDYELLNERIVADAGMSRTLWVPLGSQWAHFDAKHSKTGAIFIMQQNWKFAAKHDGSPVHQQLASLFNQPYTKHLAEVASIKYVVVPLRDTANDDEFFKYYGDDRQFYIDLLDKQPWLKRIDIGTKEVVVYENKHYRPPIATATNLLTLPTLNNLEQFYELNQKALKTDFNFALDDKNQLKHGTKVRAVFEDLNSANIQNGKVKKSLVSKTNQSSLYINPNKTTISYRINKGLLELYDIQHSGLQVNGQFLGGMQNERKMIGNAKLAPNRQYFVAIGDRLTEIPNAKDTKRNLGAVEEPVRLVSVNKTNLIANPSFENGLWQEKVEDCNSYNDAGDLDMDVSSEEHTEGKESLELTAVTHIACTGSKGSPVIPGREYLVSFDYKAIDADQASYQIIFNDPKKTTVKKYMNVFDKSWHTIRYPIVAPKGASTLTIKLLGIPNTQTHDSTTTYYDDVRLAQLDTDINPELNLEPNYTITRLSSTKNDFEYVDSSYSGKNLVPNPSFENGPWQKRVGDCDAYDNRPALKMSLSGKTSDGNKSLELAARRHNACVTTKSIPVKENMAYLLSFDHQSPNTKAANYYVGFNDPDRTSIAGTTPTKSGWQNFTRVIKIPSGAQELRLSVYANAGSDHNTYIVNRYDNFKLIEIPDIQDQYYLVDSSDKALIAPKKVSSTSVSTTKKKIHIQEAKGPFYLTMNESYHPQWRLELNNSKTTGLINEWTPMAKPDAVSESDHIKWDGFVNGWYVDPDELCKSGNPGCKRHQDGSYDLNMIIEFVPQRWFYTGSLVSATVLSGAAAYLIFDGIRRRRNREERHR
jgi:hypothetical protein